MIVRIKVGASYAATHRPRTVSSKILSIVVLMALSATINPSSSTSRFVQAFPIKPKSSNDRTASASRKLCSSPSLSSSSPSTATTTTTTKSTSLHSVSSSAKDYDGDDYDDFRLHDPPSLDATTPSSDKCASDLKKRLAELSEGIGKRFVAHALVTQNRMHQQDNETCRVPVYDQPDGKVIGHLKEGQVVLTTAPRKGPWIRHDGGGWTLSVQNGFRYLQPVNE
mmetsp:Transcript_21039/g.58527  ORF Transcript_21039/g.58527 Transcript_21039/m.58527 type:complete len:224 (-) Transcript_21039:230-901(-)|eukprot:CAMPEP_0198110740 /NCGR_PEP_ID=MMETSP1442-20131203/2744_1 /TAXON_ID= /ORGANISM="Craspedostauros australis, Strain CCMP3328" /LENGTH=223 /DNA_ID=CAMNT_0043766915 /DNA_START=276 /DNA_END=947 /DNA_ORIENTATION=+